MLALFMHSNFKSSPLALLLTLSSAVVVQAANGCNNDLQSISLVGAGASLPRQVYEDSMWTYYHTADDLTSCYYSQGSGSGVCRAKGWLPMNCTLGCQPSTGCEPCHSDCPEWEVTGQLLPPEEVDFGATDMVLSEEDYEKNPGLQLVPIMAGAVVPVYNLGGAFSERLVVDRHVLPLIFSGNLTRWNDARLKALQPPHVADMLPNAPIEVVVRGDTSGSTYILKSALMAFSEQFKSDQQSADSGRLGGADWGNQGRFNPTFQVGVSGVAGYLLGKEFTFSYMALNDAAELQLQMASFYYNHSGAIVEASWHSVSVAVVEKSFQWASIADVLGVGSSAAAGREGERGQIAHSLVDTAHDRSWPISGYTYIIINKDARSSHMRHRTCASHRAMVEFWRWFLEDASVRDNMRRRGFVAVPKMVVSVFLSWLKSKVRCDGELSTVQDAPVVEVCGSVQQEVSYEFGLMEPAYEAIAPVDLEILTHTHAGGEAAWGSNTLAFQVSIDAVDMKEQTDAAVHLMWQTFALAVLVNLDDASAQSPVRMSVHTLANVLSGEILRWDDPRLVADNLHLAGVRKNITVLSLNGNDTQCEHSLEMAMRAALQQSVSCVPSPLPSTNEAQVLERLVGTPYSISVLPMTGILGERIGRGTRKDKFIVAELKDDAADFSLPTEIALASCVPFPGVEIQMPGSCYPLHLHVFVTFKRDYGPHCTLSADEAAPQKEQESIVTAAQGMEAVKFWLWELTTFTEKYVFSDALALGPLRMHSVGPEWEAHQLNVLDQVGCGGESFLANDDQDENAVYFILLLGFVGLLLVIMALTAVIVYKNMRLKQKLVRLESTMTHPSVRMLDLDSPILKVIRYLDNVSEGKPVDTEAAQQLAEMLHRTDNFNQPDLELELATGAFGSQIKRYLLAHTTTMASSESLLNSMNERMKSWDIGSDCMSQEDQDVAGSCETTPTGRSQVRAPWPQEKQAPSPTASLANLTDPPPEPQKPQEPEKPQNPQEPEKPQEPQEPQSPLVAKGAARARRARKNRRGSISKLRQVIAVKQLGGPAGAEAEGACLDKQESNNVQISSTLETIGRDYFYDVLELDRASNGRPLTCATVFLFERMGLIKEFNIDPTKLRCYMSQIEKGYLLDNQYHNAIHATDVVQRTCTIINHCCTHLLSKLQILSALLAAAIHDLQHPGTTNAYHVIQSNPLAMRFNDQHVLENNSLLLSLGLLRRPGFDFLDNMTEFQKRKVRATVIDMVLATDLSTHFELVSKFKSKVGSKRFDGPFDDKAISLILQMILKCADVGHCTLPYRHHLYWVTCLQDEFFQQGDTEKELNMTVSPLMDRNLPGPLSRESQVGFLDVIVIPLYSALGDALDGLQPMRDQLNVISIFWKNLPNKFEVAQKPLAMLREQLAIHQATKRTKGQVTVNTPETPADVQPENTQHIDVHMNVSECLAE